MLVINNLIIFYFLQKCISYHSNSVVIKQSDSSRFESQWRKNCHIPEKRVATSFWPFLSYSQSFLKNRQYLLWHGLSFFFSIYNKALGLVRNKSHIIGRNCNSFHCNLCMGCAPFVWQRVLIFN